MLELLKDEIMEDHKESLLDLIRLVVDSGSNAGAIAETVAKTELIEDLINIAEKEKSRTIIKKSFKLLASMLNHKSLRDIIMSKHLPNLINKLKEYCKKPNCDGPWEGLYVFIRALTKLWPPIPYESVYSFS